MILRPILGILVAAQLFFGAPTTDEVWMARAIQGEVFDYWPSERPMDCAYAIGHTVLNRVADPRFPDTVGDVVKGGFWGYRLVDQPERWAIEVARTVTMERETGYDETGGALFMFSDDDIDRIFDASARRLACRQCGIRGRGMYFFTRWPEEE